MFLSSKGRVIGSTSTALLMMYVFKLCSISQQVRQDPPLAVPVEENSDGDKKTDSEKEPEKKQKKVVIKGDQKLPYSELLEVKSQLPRWYSVPNVEKAEWLNEFVEALWPYLAEGGRKVLLSLCAIVLTIMTDGSRYCGSIIE